MGEEGGAISEFPMTRSLRLFTASRHALFHRAGSRSLGRRAPRPMSYKWSSRPPM